MWSIFRQITPTFNVQRCNYQLVVLQFNSRCATEHCKPARNHVPICVIHDTLSKTSALAVRSVQRTSEKHCNKRIAIPSGVHSTSGQVSSTSLARRHSKPPSSCLFLAPAGGPALCRLKRTSQATARLTRPRPTTISTAVMTRRWRSFAQSRLGGFTIPLGGQVVSA